MVPAMDIIVPQKRNHQAGSLDSSATPSPLTDSSLTNSPATPASFSPTPSPESQSSTATLSSHSPAGYQQHNGGETGQHYPDRGGARSGASLSNGANQLPICAVKNQLMQKIRDHDTIILIGETACGKTTQIPQFIYEFYANPHFYGLIGITQPRRVAATSIATRVAQEMRAELGGLVGYTIRFEDVTSAKTRIKYMTDGILLREAISDPLLSKYRVIVLDEAHERTVHTDVLFGVVKKAQRLRNCTPKRPLDSDNSPTQRQHRPLKMIIMSATMDVDNFSRYFNQAPVYYIQGRTYPIEILYTQEKQSDYVTTALITIFQIHQQEDELDMSSSGDDQLRGGQRRDSSSSSSVVDKRSRPIGGDILVFCTGQEEIESMIKTVEDLTPQLNAFKTRSGISKTLKVYPLYAALPNGKQQAIFNRPRDDCFRRVIFSTNIAETSVTIPNIRFVIDTGKVKVRIFSPKTGFEVMQVEDISRAQAAQRSGRAGRLAPGQCYRLYTKKEFKGRPPFPVPEIQKCNLANILLQMMAMGIRDVANFDFVDPPARENIDSSLESLLLLRAIEEVKEAKVSPPAASESCSSSIRPSTTSPTLLYKLTDLGRQMVTFPVDPRFSALIIASKAFRCTDEILVIISMLSVDNIFILPSDKRDQALKMHRKFASPEGDLIKLLNVYRRYKEAKQNNAWCLENFLRPLPLRMAVEIRAQLADLCAKVDIPVVSCSGNTEQIRRCIAVGAGVGVGLGGNVASIQRSNDYQLVDFHNRKAARQAATKQSSEHSAGSETAADSLSSRSVFIHPSSCLFGHSSRPECVLFVELVHTTKSYMRNLCVIDQRWLIEYKDKKPEECARMMVASNRNTI
ncbi:putative ATP-dependent RNA helicase dhx33 [Tyrophagus putrescentiae]|nr:putative ATP-dependent RNA helicase dhx33 [Tyrophagus putrescentiae]